MVLLLLTGNLYPNIIASFKCKRCLFRLYVSVVQIQGQVAEEIRSFNPDNVHHLAVWYRSHSPNVLSIKDRSSFGFDYFIDMEERYRWLLAFELQACVVDTEFFIWHDVPLTHKAIMKDDASDFRWKIHESSHLD